MLTNTSVKSLKPSDKCTSSRPDKHSDKNGLQLWVRHTGNKTWISAYRFAGKQQSLTIGKYPEISLAEARVANEHIRSLLAQGFNPRDEKRKQKQRLANDVLFNDYAQAWLAERKQIVKPRTYQQDYNRMHKDVLPSFKGVTLNSLNFDDCKLMADNIEARKNNGKAPREVTRRTLALVEKILKRARMERLIQINPIEGIRDLYPKAKSEHMKHVDLTELPKLLKDIDNYHGHTQTRLAMKFLAYSFCRTIELRMLKWEHIDFTNKLWRVDIDNLKVARKHVVPLSKQLISVLNELRKITGKYDYVFFNTGTHKPYSEVFINNGLANLGYAGRQTGHGFRHIASTNLNELGFMGDAIEKQLAHDKKNSIRAVYNHAQHLEERRHIMQVWADFLDLLRDEGRVLNFNEAKHIITKKTNHDIPSPDADVLIEALKATGLTAEEIVAKLKANI